MLWAGIDSVNTWSQCVYWMTLKNLDNGSAPSSMIKQVHDLAKWTFDVGLKNCSSASMTPMFDWDWKQREKTLDPMVCGLQRVLICLSVNTLDLCGTPLLCLISAPGLSGLPPDMKIFYFPHWENNTKFTIVLNSYFTPHHTPLNHLFPLWKVVDGCCQKRQERTIMLNSVNSRGIFKTQWTSLFQATDK